MQGIHTLVSQQGRLEASRIAETRAFDGLGWCDAGGSAGGHPVPPSRAADAAAWSALAGLYEQLSQDDVVQVIHAKHLSRSAVLGTQLAYFIKRMVALSCTCTAARLHPGKVVPTLHAMNWPRTSCMIVVRYLVAWWMTCSSQRNGEYKASASGK